MAKLRAYNKAGNGGERDKMTGIYRIADQNIEITSLYPDVQDICRAYRVDGPPRFSVEIRQADVERERAKARRERQLEGLPPFDWPDACLEELAVYRAIAEKMPAYDGFVFHGSAVAVDGQGFVFTAKSGTGKSTHTRLWREMLGGKAVMVNDDKPILRFLDETPMIYGTPWDGKEHLSRNIAVPLRAVCILERATDNRIREIPKAEALPMLIQQTYRPADPAAMAKTLALLDRLAVKYYRLGCNMEPEAARLSYETMKH